VVEIIEKDKFHGYGRDRYSTGTGYELLGKAKVRVG
jgi:hypothetical protein